MKEYKIEDIIFQINGQQVSLGTMAKAWQETQPAPEVVPTVEKSFTFEPIHKNDERQIAYGLILRPDSPDSQGDNITPEDVMSAAHMYMAKQAGAADEDHEVILDRNKAVMVESVILGSDVTEWHGQPVDLKKGDWVGGMWIPDSRLWGEVKSGEKRAFSIRGFGIRTPVGE